MNLKDGNVQNGTLRVTIADNDTNLEAINTNTGLKGYVKNSAGSDTLDADATTATNKQNVVVSGVDSVPNPTKLNPLQVSNGGSLSTTLQAGTNDVGNVTKKMSEKGSSTIELDTYTSNGTEERFVIDVTHYKSVTVSLTSTGSIPDEKLELYMSHIKNDDENHRFYVDKFAEGAGVNNSTSLTVDNPSNFLFIISRNSTTLSNIRYLVTGESYIKDYTYQNNEIITN